ncbi:hypothetical protein OJJOAM_004343 [Cupriavidus sp. H18C1]
MADVAQFAVVVVLDDPGAVGARPGQQRVSSRHGQRHAQRILMRGRDEGHARALGHRAARLDVHAGLVDRYADHAAPVSRALQDAGDAAVGWIFDPREVIGVEQHLARQVEALLRAGGDDHLLRRAMDRAGPAHVVGNRAAERRHALGVVVTGGRGRTQRSRAIAQPAPYVVGRGGAHRHRNRKGHGRQRRELPREVGKGRGPRAQSHGGRRRIGMAGRHAALRYIG